MSVYQVSLVIWGRVQQLPLIYGEMLGSHHTPTRVIEVLLWGQSGDCEVTAPSWCSVGS